MNIIIFFDNHGCNNLYLVVNLLKWVLGFLAAFAITFGLVNAFVYLDIVNKFVDRNITYYCIYHLFLQIICFSSFAFLACYFVPKQKKYAGLLTIIVSLSFVAFGLYMNFTNKSFQGYIDIKFIINYVGITSGLLIGFYISYEKFKNKGWSTGKNLDRDIEVY